MSLMKQRGRPAGLLANPDAFADCLDGRPQRWLADQVGMSVSHLSEMIGGSKGATADVALRLADALKKRPGTLFPELAEFRTEAKVFVTCGAPKAAA